MHSRPADQEKWSTRCDRGNPDFQRPPLNVLMITAGMTDKEDRSLVESSDHHALPVNEIHVFTFDDF